MSADPAVVTSEIRERMACAVRMSAATVCPTPAEPGHGTGCMCGTRLLHGTGGERLPLTPLSLPASGVVPFGLHAPSRLIMPNMHRHRDHREQSVVLGHGEETATLVVASWDACVRGCSGGPMGNHDAGQDVRLRVPCDARPHCQSCDCLNWHEYALSPEQVAELKGVLP